jgi:hypothetical protein
VFHLQMHIEKVVHLNARLNVLFSSKKLPSIINAMGRTSPSSAALPQPQVRQTTIRPRRGKSKISFVNRRVIT